MIRKRTQAREYALQILYQLELNPQPLEILLSEFWEEHPENGDDIKEFTARLVQGVEQHLDALDEVISRYTENWQLNRMAAVDRNILRFATYELLYLEEIPPKVTINEAVNAAKKYSNEDSGKFVNGILDKINHTEKTRTSSSQNL